MYICLLTQIHSLCANSLVHIPYRSFSEFFGYIHCGTRLCTAFCFFHGWLVCIDEWLPSLHSYQQWIKFRSDTSQSKFVCQHFYAHQVIYHCYFICYFLNFCIWASLYIFAFAFPPSPNHPAISLSFFTFGGSYVFSYGFQEYLINPEIMSPLLFRH